MAEIDLHLMHCSLQFSDRKPEQKSDVQKIFARAKRRKVHWVTGTEAGATRENDNRAMLRDACAEYGYEFSVRKGNDSWVAVREDFIKGNHQVDYHEVLTASMGVGHHAARGPIVVSFDPTSPIGRVSVIACPTSCPFGAPPYGACPSTLARAEESECPKWKGVVVPARQAYSHSASVGSR